MLLHSYQAQLKCFCIRVHINLIASRAASGTEVSFDWPGLEASIWVICLTTHGLMGSVRALPQHLACPGPDTLYGEPDPGYSALRKGRSLAAQHKGRSLEAQLIRAMFAHVRRTVTDPSVSEMHASVFPEHQVLVEAP